MVVYILIAILIITFTIRARSKVTSLLLIAVLILVNYLRDYSVGTDYFGYLTRYLTTDYIYLLKERLSLTFLWENVGVDKTTEIGWLALNSIGQVFNWPYYFVDTFAKIIILSLVYLASLRQSISVYLSIALYFFLGFYFESFNILRQAIAASIFLYSLVFINEQKPIHYLLLCLLCISFHTSAIILPLFYLINYLPKINNILISVIIFSFIIPFVNIDKFLFETVFRIDVLEVYHLFLEQRGEGYFTNYNIYGKIAALIFRISQNLMLIYAIIRTKDNLKVYMYIWLIGIVLFNITIYYPWLFRMSIYFLPVQIFVLPFLLERGKSDKVPWKNVFAILYTAVVFIYIIYTGANGIDPYIIRT